MQKEKNFNQKSCRTLRDLTKWVDLSYAGYIETHVFSGIESLSSILPNAGYNFPESKELYGDAKSDHEFFSYIFSCMGCSMTISIEKIANECAYRKLKSYIIKPYQLNQQGENFVISSNKNLSDDYFERLLFPISNFWGSYFEEKINLLHPRRRDVMIDVCCGTGALCLNVIPKLGFSKCIAIDNSRVAI